MAEEFFVVSLKGHFLQPIMFGVTPALPVVPMRVFDLSFNRIGLILTIYCVNA
jgi:hypothetical protein